METIEKRIKHQFAIATRRGHFNREVFKAGGRVCLQDPLTRKFDILGTIAKDLAANDESIQSYKGNTDKGHNLVRNGSHIRHSGSEPAEPEREQSS